MPSKKAWKNAVSVGDKKRGRYFGELRILEIGKVLCIFAADIWHNNSLVPRTIKK